MQQITLYDYWRSSAAYRVRIALELKGVDYTRALVDLAAGEQRQADYRQRNPQGLVPMLEVDGLALTQSLAIVDYLDSMHPEPRLIPAGSADRAHVLALAMIVACDIHPLNNLRVLKYLGSELQAEQAARDAWYTHWVREGLAALEAAAAPHAGTFLFGDAPTLADVFLVPQMYNARRFNVPVNDLPLLVRADAAACALAGFAAAHPDRVAPGKTS
jgi:maleylacetoacetate isomerase